MHPRWLRNDFLVLLDSRMAVTGTWEAKFVRAPSGHSSWFVLFVSYSTVEDREAEACREAGGYDASGTSFGLISNPRTLPRKASRSWHLLTDVVGKYPSWQYPDMC